MQYISYLNKIIQFAKILTKNLLIKSCLVLYFNYSAVTTLLKEGALCENATTLASVYATTE